MIIGLKQGIVKLRKHNLKWKQEFNKEKQILVDNLGQEFVAVEHIGSTAIPGIKAKPIIDIAAGTLNAPNKNLLGKKLAKLGYEFRSLVSRDGYHLFYAKGPTENRTHYLHISKFNSKRWLDDLKFIGILKSNKKLAKDYENLKLILASRYATNREKYTKNKAKFIKNILSK